MRNSYDSGIHPQEASVGWCEAWKRRRFRVQLVGSVLLLVVGLQFFTRFLLWVEQREGVRLNDPILAVVPPADFTWLTFGVIYAAVLLGLIHLAPRPYRLLLAIHAYMLMVMARAAMMFLVPLEPAEGLIVLHDPFVQFAGDGSPPTKDLFFSGHTSTLFLLFLVIQNPVLKRLFLVFTALVGVMVIWQHVHYVIDVLVAPFVAYACYRVARALQMRSMDGYAA